ncbi:MAG TPA: YcxB family protein [Puia sp.]|nr:YcxB family protein [Puia sp.]
MNKFITLTAIQSLNMDDFTITTRLTKGDYSRFLYSELYKKPAFILATLFGIYLIVSVMLSYSGMINFYTKTPYVETVCGIFILLGPTLVVLAALRGFSSNPGYRHDMVFTFGQDGFRVQGLTFKSEMSWAHIIKQKETRKYLILYSSKRLGNFIDKSTLTGEQIHFIKAKVVRR